MELDKIIPADGPNINEVEKYINKYQSEVIVIKCGGSVLLDKKLFNQFIEDISVINKIGLSAIVVHGGGKNIKKKLDENNIETRFIKGLRVSDEKTIRYIEEALLELNLEILHELKSKNTNVCSISPKENNVINIIPESKELGYVGKPKKINKEKVYFPGYIMIKANLSGEIPHIIKSVTNVIGFLGETKGGDPIPLRTSEVNRMLGKVDELTMTTDHIAIPFSRGENVKVIDGPFNGFNGSIEKVNEEKRKLEVMVKIFGRKTPLELSYMQVEKL